MVQENLNDFGREIEADETFCFECHPGLGCFGTCCKTDVVLTSYDIAGLRKCLELDTETFLSTYVTTFADEDSGFPSVLLKRREDGLCVFSQSGACAVYENRPGCCRGYPISRVVEEDRITGKRQARYRLQHGADYCEGLGRGTEWAVAEYCHANGLEPYDRANDLFLDVVFEFYGLPQQVRSNRDIQQMIHGVIYNFDRFFREYGPGSYKRVLDDRDELMGVVRELALKLLERAAESGLNK